MISIDPVLLEAFRYSHVKSSYLSVYEGTTQVSALTRISEGSVTADRNQKARRKLDCTIPLSQWEDVVGLNVMASRLQVWTGYDLGGSQVLVPIGVFRVDEIGRTNAGALKVSATSLESYVIDHAVVDTADVPKNTVIIPKIQALILDSFPDATFELDAWATSQSTTTLEDVITGKRDRWELILDLAFTVSCDVYTTPSGKFRICKRPSMQDLVPVWRINEGPDGVLVEMNTKVSRQNTYNAVMAMAQSSSSDTVPETAIVYDDDPASPTRWGGPFGKKMYIYQSDTLHSTQTQTTKQVCYNKAVELLAFYVAQDRSLDLSAIPNPALEPDDAVQVTMLDGTVENHLITSMTIPLGLGTWTAQTLSNKDAGLLNPEKLLALESRLR